MDKEVIKNLQSRVDMDKVNEYIEFFKNFTASTERMETEDAYNDAVEAGKREAEALGLLREELSNREHPAENYKKHMLTCAKNRKKRKRKKRR